MKGALLRCLELCLWASLASLNACTCGTGAEEVTAASAVTPEHFGDEVLVDVPGQPRVRKGAGSRRGQGCGRAPEVRALRRQRRPLQRAGRADVPRSRRTLLSSDGRSGRPRCSMPPSFGSTDARWEVVRRQCGLHWNVATETRSEVTPRLGQRKAIAVTAAYLRVERCRIAGRCVGGLQPQRDALAFQRSRFGEER